MPFHPHLPKPMHGWRAFVGEVGIIVIGVLIALGAEQVVEAGHHRSQVAEAVAKLRAESLGNRDGLAFSQAGLQQSIAGIDRDLGALGSCDRAIDTARLQPIERQAFLVPLNAAWLGVRDSALLPLMPADVVDSYWKIDAIGTYITPMLENVSNAFDDAAAALDTLRGGVNDRQSCAQAVYQLHRLKSAERTLSRQAAFYQNSNDQVLRGAGLGLASTKQVTRANAQQSD